MTMDEHNDRQIRDALKQSFPPATTELRRDLWPDILRRLDAHSVSVPWYDWVLVGLRRDLWPDILRRLDAHSVSVPWYDWVLVGLSGVAFLAFPRLVLVLAYHL